jgi:hypothetical protein
MESVAAEGWVALGKRGRSDGAEQIRPSVREREGRVGEVGGGFGDVGTPQRKRERSSCGPVSDGRMPSSPVRHHGRPLSVACTAAAERHMRRN